MHNLWLILITIGGILFILSIQNYNVKKCNLKWWNDSQWYMMEICMDKEWKYIN